METIAEFKNYRWSNHGKLFRGRMAHGAITIDNKTYVIGGKTEGNT